MEEFFRTLADTWLSFGGQIELFVDRIRADEQAGTILAITGASAVGVLMGFFMRQPKPPVTVPEEEKAPDLLPAPTEIEKTIEEAEPSYVLRYRASLQERNVTSPDQELLVREFARHYNKLVDGFSHLTAEDPDAVQLLDRAEESLIDGDIHVAIETLDKASERDSAVGRDMKKAADRRLAKSAAVKEMAGDLEMAQLNYAQAAEFYREALAMNPNEDGRYAESLNKHGQAAFNAGDFEAASKSFEKAASILSGLPEDQQAGSLAAGEVLNNLAMLYYNEGNLDEAEKLYRRALQSDEKQFGDDHEMVAKDLNNLALLYKKQGKFKEAEPLLKRSITIKERLLDPSDPSLITGLKNYAALLRAVIKDEKGTIQVPAANDEEKKMVLKNKTRKPMTIKQVPNKPEAPKPAPTSNAAKGKAPPPPPLKNKPDAKKDGPKGPPPPLPSLKNKPAPANKDAQKKADPKPPARTGGIKAISGAGIIQKPKGPQIKNVVRS